MFKRADIENIPIEKGVPIPENNKVKSNSLRFPLDKMKAGDSIVIGRDIMQKYDVTPKMIRDAARYDAIKIDIGIATRMTHEGLRIWRIE